MRVTEPVTTQQPPAAPRSPSATPDATRSPVPQGDVVISGADSSDAARAFAYASGSPTNGGTHEYAIFAAPLGGPSTPHRAVADAQGANPKGISDRVRTNKRLLDNIEFEYGENKTTITINVTIGAEPNSGVSATEVRAARNRIRRDFNRKATFGGRTYELRTNIRTLTSAERKQGKTPDVVISRCPLTCKTKEAPEGGPGRATVGESVIELRGPHMSHSGRIVPNGNLGRYTESHEFAHVLGFQHADNGTGSIRSYAERRQVTGRDMYLLWDAYRVRH